MKIAFIHDWTMPINEYLDNEDGLPAAVSVIARSNHVLWCTGGPGLTFLHNGYTLSFVPSGESLTQQLTAFAPDVIIAWGSLDRPWHQLVHERFPGIPKVLCFAGGTRNHIAKSYFRVIVCESQVYIDDFTKAGVTATRGFGTNVRVFKPLGLPKTFNAIFPASFCFHKNLELFARSFEGAGLLVGNHNEPTVVSKVLSFGTPIMSRVSSATLAYLYNLSRVTVVTCGPDGGAQRVVLESMACGVPVVVMSDHDRCVEFVRDSGFGRVCNAIDVDIREAVQSIIDNPPERTIGTSYINSHWTENHYAEALLSACRQAMLN